MAYYVIDVATGNVANAFEQQRDAQQYAEAKQARIVTEQIDNDGENDDVPATAGAVQILGAHIVESHTEIDERFEEIEERLDRAERDIDTIDGGEY